MDLGLQGRVALVSDPARFVSGTLLVDGATTRGLL